MSKINAGILIILTILFICGIMLTSQASTGKWRVYDDVAGKCVPVEYDCIPEDVNAD
jgi:hypothetical protein